MLSFLSKLEPRHQGPLPRSGERRSRRGGRQYGTETGSGLAGDGIPGLSSESVRERRVIWLGPVEDVGELGADLQTGSFLNTEVAAQTQVLRRPALIPVIVVVDGSGAKLARRRVGPRRRIQHKSPVGI